MNIKNDRHPDFFKYILPSKAISWIVRERCNEDFFTKILTEVFKRTISQMKSEVVSR